MNGHSQDRRACLRGARTQPSTANQEIVSNVIQSCDGMGALWDQIFSAAFAVHRDIRFVHWTFQNHRHLAD
jgi:hypothetical protein